jgi:diaminopimelate decarboxylase
MSKAPTLEYRHNELHIENSQLSDLAHRFGTPLYCYAKNDLVGRYRAFDRAFKGTPHTICYSVKANSNISVLRTLAKEGAGFDVVSGGELERVVAAARGAGKKVVFSGVGKTPEEMLLALKRNILMFNVESEQELETLERVALKAKKKVQIAVRVNPHVSAATHPYISTGLQEHKFGVPIAESRILYSRAVQSRVLRPVGVSVHIGSQITDFSAFAETMTRVASLVRELRVAGVPISVVDAGGGLGMDYHKPEGVEQFAERAKSYAEAITDPLTDLNVHLILEPGRSLAARSGVLLTRVLYVKENNGKCFAVVDAAMNDLLRPSLYQAHHRVIPAHADETRPVRYDVVGPVCESGDFIAKDRTLQELEAGDLLAVLDVGAYGMTLASNYNTRPRAAEILVDGRAVKLIRKRETVRDLMRFEI